ncbi:MAG: hypothetical protein ACYTG0_04775 [Planctomycetota bacterium]
MIVIMIVGVAALTALFPRGAGELDPDVLALVRMYYAIGTYDSGEGRLPPAILKDLSGATLASWRFAMLPYLECRMPVRDRRVPWGDPANAEAVQLGNVIFRASPDEDAGGGRFRQIVAVTGPGTAFDGEQPQRLSALPSDLILLVERPDTMSHWAAPGDLDVADLPEDITAGRHGKGVHVAFADSAVWFIRCDVPVNVLSKFLTIDGARECSRDELLAPYGKRVLH